MEGNRRKAICVSERTSAVDFLVNNYSKWPELPVGSIISDVKFSNWRFVKSTEGPLLFANCIEPGISEIEWNLEKDRLLIEAKLTFSWS